MSGSHRRISERERWGIFFFSFFKRSAQPPDRWVLVLLTPPARKHQRQGPGKMAPPMSNRCCWAQQLVQPTPRDRFGADQAGHDPPRRAGRWPSIDLSRAVRNCLGKIVGTIRRGTGRAPAAETTGHLEQVLRHSRREGAEDLEVNGRKGFRHHHDEENAGTDGPWKTRMDGDDSPMGQRRDALQEHQHRVDIALDARRSGRDRHAIAHPANEMQPASHRAKIRSRPVTKHLGEHAKLKTRWPIVARGDCRATGGKTR